MTTAATGTVDALRQAAAKALDDGTAAVVIGFRPEEGVDHAVPVFVRSAEDADRLTFDGHCFGNLAVYLPRPEIRALGRTGIVVKGCDLRAVNVLLHEHVIEREDVYLIGVRCASVGDPPLGKCAECEVHDPPGCDVVVGEAIKAAPTDTAKRYRDIDEMDAAPLEERWAFWQAHFDRCIKCYACRQVCPLCYCKRCIVEKTVPAWVESSPHLRGNLAWNVARALHLTGRCVGCGECERACPMGIPLTAINRKMARVVEERYGFRSGRSADEEAPFSTFSTDDSDEGIL